MPATAPAEIGLAERFVYWTGLSGTRYLHTVYKLDECPDLPGAVFLAVKTDERGARKPVAVGRIAPLPGLTLSGMFRSGLKARGVDEVHLHLLAETGEFATRVIEDLQLAHGCVARPAEPVRVPA